MITDCNHERMSPSGEVHPRGGWQIDKRPLRSARNDVRRLAATRAWRHRPNTYDKPDAFRRRVRFILKECIKKHPSISIEKSIFGGMPHLHKLRLSVGDVLSQIYMRGSIRAVVEYYAPYVTEEKIKEALAFAQDVLEIPCDPHKTDG